MLGQAAINVFNYIDEVGIDNVTTMGLMEAGLTSVLENVMGDKAGKMGADAFAKGMKKLGVNVNDLGKMNVDVGGNDGVDLELKMKQGWTPQQHAAAKEKAKALTEADTEVVKNPTRQSNTKSRFEKAGGSTSKSEDVDHVIDLQLGGADNPANMKALDKSVNRSMGAQIQQQTKNLPEGTKINKVIIK